MARIMCGVAGFMMASVVVQANQCSSGGECPSDDEPKKVVSLLQRALQIDVLQVGGQEKELQINMLKVGGQGRSREQVAELMMRDPSLMLTELEDMVASGTTPSYDVIAMIKSIVQDQLMPQINDLHNASAWSTTDLLKQIQRCNDASKKHQGNLDDARSLHADCRDEEQSLHVLFFLCSAGVTISDSFCANLAKQLQDAPSIPVASTREMVVEYAEYMWEVNMCGDTNIRQGCNTSAGRETQLKNKQGECRIKQQQFELAFCMRRFERTSNCHVLDTCHAHWLTAYNNHVTQAQVLEEKWNREIVTLHKIICYCNVWLSHKDVGDNRSAINATQFVACKDQTHTPVHVNTNYGTPAEKVPCDLTSVANYPGTPGFLTEEYSNFTGFVSEAVFPCESATTATPSTAAPTTSQ